MDTLNIQPYLLMLMSMSKNDSTNSNNSNYLYLLIIILPFISNIIPFSDIKEWIVNVFTKDTSDISINIKSHEIPIVRGNTPHTKLIYSINYLAIIHYIMTNNISDLQSMTEILANSTELNMKPYTDESKDTNTFIFLPLQKKKILISSKYQIYCEISDVKNNNNDDADNKKKSESTTTVKVHSKNNFIITLSKKKNNHSDMKILKKFTDECVDEYNKFINSKNSINNIQYIFEYKSSDISEDTVELFFDEYKMEHNKDLLVNIFFEQKQKLINYINPFIYDPSETINIGEEQYKRSGFTFKAGLLFYGSPGCGKTSTIKAILKYTNRHGIIINLSKVKTSQELQNLFRKRKFKNNELSGKQICYILEDCDAFDTNIVTSRKNKHEDNEFKKNSEVSEISQLAQLMVSPGKLQLPIDEGLNLSCFLNILDGIIELHGIMIIMTTNYPEKIDEALIRPGRFDFKHEFKRASRNIIMEMLQFKFELTHKELITHTQIFSIKNEILSPAEIQSICFKNDNIDECIHDIILASQKNI